jgi:predicted hotdog family 3-hydroxylacyl-ACP dehydratase
MARNSSPLALSLMKAYREYVPFFDADDDITHPVPMLLLARLVNESEQTLRVRLDVPRSTDLQVDDELEVPSPDDRP